MDQAVRAFDRKLAKLRGELERNVAPGEALPLLVRLDAVGAAVEEMTREGRLVFSHFRMGRPAIAAGHMANMDKRFAGVNSALGELRLAVAEIQKRQFEEQTRAAAQKEKFEYGIGLLVLLMVGGATIYGHRLGRQMQADFAEKERHIKAIADAQAQRMLALSALRETNQRLQALFKRMLEAEEAQRQHIARELHEEVAQMVASLKLRLDSMPVAPAVRKHLEPHVAAAGSIAEDALHRLRDLASDLVPNGLEVLGLQGILATHLNSWTVGSPLAVHFSEHLSSIRPGFKVEIAAYRVAEEAVANVVLHAEARELRVELRRHAGELHLQIEDDGIGFDVDAARREAALGNGSGITLMEQRAALHGGKLEIVSRPGAGTKVRAVFPAG